MVDISFLVTLFQFGYRVALFSFMELHTPILCCGPKHLLVAYNLWRNKICAESVPVWEGC